MAWITGPDILGHPGVPPDLPAGYAALAATSTCALVETLCNRVLDPLDYREWQERIGPHTLLVAHPPIRELKRACTGSQQGLSLTNTTADANSITLSIQDGSMFLAVLGGASAGTATITLSTVAPLTMAALLAAIVGLAPTQNWAGAVVNEGSPENLKPGHLGNVLDEGTLYPLLPDGEATVDLIDRADGLIYITNGWSAGAEQNFVHYSGGFSPVPPDLTAITLDFAVDLLRESLRDGSLTSERLDKYAWTRAANGALTTKYKALLQPWRRIPMP